MQQQPQQAVEHGREPCPDRILDDIGGAFGMGALGGGFWHMYRGLKNSPKGYKIAGALDVSGTHQRSHPAAVPQCVTAEQLPGGGEPHKPCRPLCACLQTIRREAPRMGGNFANWGLMFSVFDCTCLYIRQKVRLEAYE